MKTAFVGAGTMGEAIIAALLRDGAKPGDIVACDVSAARREHLAATHGIAVEADATAAVRDAATVVLAVKPQDFATACAPIAAALRPEQTVVSIMAGVRTAELRRVLKHAALVRAMPNTPGQIGAGFTAWTATPEVSEGARTAVATLLATLGVAVEVPDEKHIDLATAVSASGPGFVYLVIEALIDGAVEAGLGRDLATRMVVETVLGSAKFMQATGEHPATLRNRVTSPGGTTAAGLAEMEAHGVRAGIAAAIAAAHERARELGG